jgi:hypothetical protein
MLFFVLFCFFFCFIIQLAFFPVLLKLKIINGNFKMLFKLNIIAKEKKKEERE